MSYVFRRVSSLRPEKKVLVVCLAGARSLLQPEKKSSNRVSGGCAGKKKFQSSVWRVRDCYYDRKKMFQLSVWRVRDHYCDRKKKVLVVCLAGARSLLRPEKKVSSRLSGGCAIVITTRKKSSSCDFYAKLNVSNLNVTNLYQFQVKLI